MVAEPVAMLMAPETIIEPSMFKKVLEAAPPDRVMVPTYMVSVLSNVKTRLPPAVTELFNVNIAMLDVLEP